MLLAVGPFVINYMQRVGSVSVFSHESDIINSVTDICSSPRRRHYVAYG